MAIRDDLIREEEISAEEVDTILLNAHKMFEKDEQGKGKKSLVVDLEDIPLKFIDQALEEHHTEKKERQEAVRDAAEKAARDERVRKRQRIFLGAGTFASVLLGCIVTAYLGKGPIDDAYIQVRQTQENVRSELERHTLLEERFAELSGEAGTQLDEMQTTEKNTKGVLNRTQGAIVHELAMAKVLRELPEAEINAISVRRLDLQADVMTSTKSLQEAKSALGQAEAEWRGHTETFTGWTAVVLGLAPGPTDE
jgi:hypothetical protein